MGLGVGCILRLLGILSALNGRLGLEAGEYSDWLFVLMSHNNFLDIFCVVYRGEMGFSE